VFDNNFSLRTSSAFVGSKVGGSLIDNLTVVSGLRTFPAVAHGGNPSAKE